MFYRDLQDNTMQTSLGVLHYKKTSFPGKKVVFLHGLGADTMVFKRLIEILPAKIEAYLIDLLGHGESEAPDIDYTVQNQAKAVSEFIKEMEMEQSCYLFGSSYGGWVAATIAQGKYNGLGVVLEDAVGLKEYFEDIAKAFTPEEYRKKVLKDMQFMNPNKKVIDSVLNSDQITSSYLTSASLANIVKPAMVVWGEKDTTVDVKYATLFNEYIKGSTLEIIPEAGHVPHYTHPQKISELLLSFTAH